ncbi:hypothetical protein LAZ67_X000475 [Cordylochernes scorpioides]|uniref:Uncharacterized protein n=1 Tax=Cordylochernes scorpioides TaxID=51811 RepID=A0ABY6LTN2_9ARAC|nr:hypothetical protein LAZ67_X000475 [Cordylochernes scorpioides]
MLQRGINPNYCRYQSKGVRTSLEDDPHEGRPKSATTLDTIKKVHFVRLDDKEVKVCEIAMAMEYRKKGCRTSCTKNWNAKAQHKVGSSFAEFRSKANL